MEYILCGVFKQNYIVLAQIWSTYSPYSPPIRAHNQPWNFACESPLAFPPDKDYLQLLWGVHFSFKNSHAKCSLAMAPLDPN